MSVPEPLHVTDNAEQSRFELTVDGRRGELLYQRQDGQIVLLHVGVPKEIDHRGIGGMLVSAAVDEAEREQLRIVPLCPFARHWLRANPGEAGRVVIDWP